ncbi:unnamed protein product [Lepeophtheirus salmonis]|uniref:(salmon louse) hypothetical protein n=1 Tax=Lepeophtheirus salmonis TaxID=72036 RepID=A0A7R8CSN4_LEPSM|nr:unnamed protein product [Lepeophtheirus salmonis]CAF2916581.1 unnamed protein product [Lepeophtheirus salmonis]
MGTNDERTEGHTAILEYLKDTLLQGTEEPHINPSGKNTDEEALKNPISFSELSSSNNSTSGEFQMEKEPEKIDGVQHPNSASSTHSSLSLASPPPPSCTSTQSPPLTNQSSSDSSKARTLATISEQAQPLNPTALLELNNLSNKEQSSAITTTTSPTATTPLTTPPQPLSLITAEGDGGHGKTHGGSTNSSPQAFPSSPSAAEMTSSALRRRNWRRAHTSHHPNASSFCSAHHNPIGSHTSHNHIIYSDVTNRSISSFRKHDSINSSSRFVNVSFNSNTTDDHLSLTGMVMGVLVFPHYDNSHLRSRLKSQHQSVLRRTEERGYPLVQSVGCSQDSVPSHKSKVSQGLLHKEF